MVKKKLFRLLCLFIFGTLLSIPKTFAQGPVPHNIVRLVYFVPHRRQPQSDIDTKLDRLIKNTQEFFANEMVRHGFGPKTFVFETNRDGNAMVHRVNGRFLDAHYHHQTNLKVQAEVSQQFDFSRNVYLMVVDISSEHIDGACGKGGDSWNSTGDWGGRAFIPASGRCLNTNFGVELAAHELGHAFSLFHDFSNDAYIMSYGSNRTALARCTAEWLDANRYFNTRKTPANNSRTTFQMHPPVLLSSPYTLRFRFDISDPDGLQQAQLLTLATSVYEGPGEPKLIGCEKLAREHQTVEFVTDKLTAQSQSVILRIVDGAGNYYWETYPLATDALSPHPRDLSIPDANLASLVRNALGLRRFSNITQLDMLKLTALFANNQQITDLTGLEHAANLKYLFFEQNQITDIAILETLPNLAVLSLASNQIKDFTPIAGLTKLLELDISENPSDDISPVTGLTQLQALNLRGYDIQDLTPFTGFTELRHLDFQGNRIDDLTPFTELTQLRSLGLGNNQIRDLTPLTELIHLEGLDLSSNQIRDIEPLDNLTQLQILLLSDNQISDLTPLTGLENLTHLTLSNNQIRDLAPLTRLQQLTTLWLINNQATNLKPLTRLFNLAELKVAHNPIADRKPLQVLLERNSSLELDIDPRQLAPVVHNTGIELPAMYWTDTETSGFYRLVGKKKRVETATLGVQNITALAVDVSAGKLYWIEQTSPSHGEIWLANPDGSNAQVLKGLFSTPHDIAVDTRNGKIYCTNANGKIQRLNLNGSNFEANFITDLDMPKHIALDVSGGKLYWTEAGERIRRANLDGTNLDTLLTDLATLSGIAVADGKLYWTEQTGASAGKIRSANLDGTNVQTLATIRSAPIAIAVDVTQRKLYWSNSAGRIQRANLNGKNIQTVITGLGKPIDLALGTEMGTLASAPVAASVFPENTALLPNYPNPFNPETWIPYQLAEPAAVTLHIYRLNGTLIRTLTLGHQPAGSYKSRHQAAYWDGKNESGETVASGLYFYTLSAGDFTATRKMFIVK